MKLKQLFASLALASLSLLSCSQESEVHPLPEPGQEPATKVMQVTLETEEATLENGLRLDQQIDWEGKPISPLMSDKPVKIRIAVRLNDDYSTISYQTLTFEKVGPLKVRYQGALTVPAGSAPATDKYYISGILLAEDGVDGRVFTEIEGDEATSSIVNVKPATGLVVANESNVLATTAPYVADWKEVKLVDGTNKPVTMTFKPSGTLLRFQVTNDNDTDVTVEGIKVETNAFFKDWKYDFSQARTTTNTILNLAAGQRADVNAWSETFAVTETLTAKTVSKWYYIWVMPVKAGSTGLSAKVTVLHSGGQESLSFQSGSAPTVGSVAVKLPLKLPASTDGNFGGYNDGSWGEGAATNGFPNSKLPYEYFAGFANKAGNGVVELSSPISNSDSRLGYFSHTQAQALNISGYRWPSVAEMQAIIPPRAFNLELATGGTGNIVETVVIGGETIVSAAAYRIAPGVESDNNAVYGLRFRTSNNSMRMAIKIERVGDSMTGAADNNTLKISMKYIGTDNTKTADYISGPERATYWADAHHIYLPMPGQYTPGAPYGDYWANGQNLYLRTNDPLVGMNASPFCVLYRHVFSGSTSNRQEDNIGALLSVPLFKTNP